MRAPREGAASASGSGHERGIPATFAFSKITFPAGRVTAVNGSQATIVIEAGVPTAGEAAQVTVGRFMGIIRGTSTIIGLVTEVTEQQTNPDPLAYRSIARLDLIGEIGPDRQFQRGVADYPTIGNPVVLVDHDELGLIYGGADNNRAHVGDLQQDTSIGVNVHIDDLISKHFAILGTTGVGKSSASRSSSTSPGRRARICASSWSIRITNMAAASATRRRCSRREICACRSGCSISRR